VCNIKAGDWVIGIKEQGAPTIHTLKPYYVHRVTKDPAYNEDVYMLYLSSSPSVTAVEGWFSYRYKKYSSGQRIINKKVRIA